MNDTEANETASEVSNARPIAKFSGSGGLQVAIWKDKTDGAPDRYTVRSERVYKDSKTDEFKTTNYLRDSDLLRLTKLLNEADNWIEQDKQQGRGKSQASR